MHDFRLLPAVSQTFPGKKQPRAPYESSFSREFLLTSRSLRSPFRYSRVLPVLSSVYREALHDPSPFPWIPCYSPTGAREVLILKLDHVDLGFYILVLILGTQKKNAKP